MDISAKNQWQVRLAALALFIVGFAAGALSLNIYLAKQSASAPPTRHEGFHQMLQRLKLTPDQETQVKSILDDARTRFMGARKECGSKFRDVRTQTDERIRTVLTPEQWQKYQQMVGEIRERYRHTRDHRQPEP